MQIFIKTLTGKTLTFDVEPSDSIQSIKDKIFDIEGVPLELQRLIAGGKHLENGKTLTECNIGENSIIYMVVPFRTR